MSKEKLDLKKVMTEEVRQEFDKTHPTPSIFIEESVEERVEALAKMVREIDDDYAALSARLKKETLEAQDQLNQKIEIELISFRNEIKGSLVDIQTTLTEIRKRFTERVHDEVRRVTSQEIAESLSKKILVVRNANREELKSANTLAFRQATPSEIRNQ